MTDIPVIAFAAYSGAGKTTLIEKLIRELKHRGLRLAVLKHDGHSFEIDHEGKDSQRFTKAGADITVISSAEQTAFVQQGNFSLKEVLDMIHDVDLILVEGYKKEPLPQIGMARMAAGQGFTADLSRFEAIVTDYAVETTIPCFGFEDIKEIADFILEKMTVEHTTDFTHFNREGRAL